MPRPLGKRNPDYDEKRERLVRDLTDFVLKADLVRPSFRQLAQAGGVAEPTLRHYFGDRDCVAKEILRELGERARPFLDAVSDPRGGLTEAVDAYVLLSQAGVAHGGFARAHAFGLIEGVGEESVGRAYLTELLEPSLVALERRLGPHLGLEPGAPDLRVAALLLFAPMLLSVIHQQLLGGSEIARMDLHGAFGRLAGFAKDALAGAQKAVDGGKPSA